MPLCIIIRELDAGKLSCLGFNVGGGKRPVGVIGAITAANFLDFSDSRFFQLLGLHLIATEQPGEIRRKFVESTQIIFAKSLVIM